ncbi:uncharacterized protein BYT42DRAFT_615734 [Radiomyces spectabilis]|uniref:uncharacterized protein n=1 Tax=Radiomyces spectabilis TaxID=64574 RepID=UPI00221FD6BB|nr:uncharacterized protein BYT42DRAFT_615734 [Radiomyces spectabilis]KAI8374585.1 hypothetical protein BYT42DRAFT_615734 [Radiomyces spectabilis]
MTATAEWVYAAGSSWVAFDAESQRQIEGLWTKYGASWIKSRSFGGKAIFVNTAQLTVTYNNYTTFDKYEKEKSENKNGTG